MTASAVPIRFVIGSRQVLAPVRRLKNVAFSLQDLINQRVALPQTSPRDADGFRILSAAQGATQKLARNAPGLVMGGLQSYRRFYIDMSLDFDEYLAHFSARTRSTLRRKKRRLARESGGALQVRAFRTPEEISQFHAIAVPLSRRTYQARLLDAGLPEGPEACRQMTDLAARDAVRAFLLYLGDQPISYLYLPVRDGTVIYSHLGYDQDFARLSPGTVLQLAALEQLFAERAFRYFDFTEGEGAHKAMFGNRSAAACSFYLLNDSLRNRILLSTLDHFNASVAGGRRLAESTGAAARVRQFLRH